MNIIKTIRLGLAAVLACASASTAWAGTQASAVATSEQGAYAWATRSTQAEADKAALAECQRLAQGKRCSIGAGKAFVVAKSETRYGYASSGSGVADARKEALKFCQDKDCKVANTVTDPGFYALAVTLAEEGQAYVTHLAYGYDNADKAAEEAKANCEKNAARACELVHWNAVRGVVKTQDPPPAPKPAPVAQGDCRPKTATLRCRSQCTNGNCLVTYENNCQIRVQVQPRLDPFTNQWTYPAPSC